MFVVALTWSCLVALFYDYPLHRDQRARNYYVGESLRQVVAPDSIFFTAPVIDPFMRLIENTRVRIAFPNRDRFKDFPKLLEFHLKSGRRAYGAFHEAVWNRLKEGPLAGYVVTPKFSPLPGFWVSEIHLPHNSGQSPAK
jgi:hypothetical protein